ncbi:hypothetical protein BH708_12945 [Brachybacterium sp. P6-10-X1]|uniref:NUDIX domain-containing protein n=1 Tax=Brachybacterium sp. P6-10-X1 TaxID=1903186 RepID=UPI0009718DDA|nr:NUDIX domain-containing protein [Brachybacterium sp. P6-10-X1]APX33473.1 hypothetical protein BH708_12945 [Brachybacterium sp. P6-10-X1]
MRIRAVAVVIEQGHLLVIRRRRDGREYSVLPGGGIEPGETPQDACRRELALAQLVPSAAREAVRLAG